MCISRKDWVIFNKIQVQRKFPCEKITLMYKIDIGLLTDTISIVSYFYKTLQLEGGKRKK